jgi:hypothetical protein
VLRQRDRRDQRAQNPREIARYRRAAEQAVLARKGMADVARAFGGASNQVETLFGNQIGNPGEEGLKWAKK